MTQVWDSTQFRGVDLLVLLCLADHANDEGICWPSFERVAHRARCSYRHVFRVMKHLEQEGWIAREGKRRTKKGQWVNVLRILPHDTASPQKNESAERHDIFDGSHDAMSFDPLTSVSRKPSVEPSKESSCARSGDRASKIPDWIEVIAYAESTKLLDSGRLSQATDAWLESVELGQLTNWQAHLRGFLQKYASDIRGP